MTAKQKGQVETLTGKLDAAYAAIKRLEGDVKSAQRRLHAKSLEVAAARQARKEALTLLREAASKHPEIGEQAIALLAADVIADKQKAEEAEFLASQTSIPGTEAAQAGA